jgi:hypothetical protein
MRGEAFNMFEYDRELSALAPHIHYEANLLKVVPLGISFKIVRLVI